jgi:hypothetical protein
VGARLYRMHMAFAHLAYDEHAPNFLTHNIITRIDPIWLRFNELDANHGITGA